MAVSHESPVCLAVLNPKGRDPSLDYSNGPDRHEPGVHPPINYHAFAAATFGAFFDSTSGVIKERERFQAVLVLIRRRCWISLAAVQKLKEAGLTVIVAWKECGDQQNSQQLQRRRAQKAYGKILSLCDGVISPTSSAPPRVGEIGEAAFRQKARLLPTPYPLEYHAWDFSKATSDRQGVMIGTREFGTSIRNHRQAVERMAAIARELDIPRVTVINSEKRKGLAQLRSLAERFPPKCLNIVERPLPYPEYLALLSDHRVVYQMDHSNVPGQVAGDCLLARSLCAGGNSTVERIAFSDLSDHGARSQADVTESLAQILASDEAYELAVARSQQTAAKRLSYTAIANQLGEWNILE